MPASVDLRIGIDVGGTNTDAVVLDVENRLLAKFKTPTTPDLTSGIATALEAVLGQIDQPVDAHHPRHARDDPRDQRHPRAP